MNFVNEGHSVREGVGEREFPVEEGVGKPWISQMPKGTCTLSSVG